MDEDEQQFWTNTLEEFEQLMTMLRSQGRVLPFDADRLMSPNPMVYDSCMGWGVGDHVGAYAIIKAGTLVDLLGETEESPEDIGLIVAQANGRIVVFNERTDSYVGWISPDDYKIIDVFFPETQPWMH